MIFVGSLAMTDGILSGELRDQTGYRIPLCATLVKENGKVTRIELTGTGVMPANLALPGESGFVEPENWGRRATAATSPLGSGTNATKPGRAGSAGRKCNGD